MDMSGARATTRLAAVACLLAFPCHATNGYFPHGWGAKSAAMAGAGSALAEDAMIAATNPAGIAALQRNEYQIGLGLIKAEPTYTAGPFDPPGQAPPPGSFPLDPRHEEADPDVRGNVFLVPQGAVAWRVSPRSVAGVAVYANGGLNATYTAFENPTCPEGTQQRGVYCGGVASSDISQVFVAPTYAWQFNDALRVGASLILAVQSIEIRGLSAFAPLSQNPEHLTDQGHELSYGYGVKLGAQARLRPGLHAGAVVQSRVDMSRLQAYEGLFADGANLDVPPYATVGLAWDLNAQWTTALDLQRIWYSTVPALGNDIDAPGPLGAANGPGFGWNDVNAWKLGLRYAATPRWTLRAGYSYTEQPVDDHQLFFNILAGSVLSRHYTAGFTYRRQSGSEFDVSVMYAPKQELSGPNPLYPDQELKVSLGGLIMDFIWRGFF